MKVWYYAVCDACGEAQYVMVNNPLASAAYLGEQAGEIEAWLFRHINCELRLAWRDDHVDVLFNMGWRHPPDDRHLLRRPAPTPEVPEPH